MVQSRFYDGVCIEWCENSKRDLINISAEVKRKFRYLEDIIKMY